MDRSVDLNWVRCFIKMNQKEQMWDGRGGGRRGDIVIVWEVRMGRRTA